MVTVFLTGATGYLGSTFLSTIPETWNIVCYGRHPPVGPQQPNVTWNRGDISNEQDRISIPEGVDAIIHLAAIKGQGSCANNPSEVIKTNILGTHRLLDAAKEHDIKKFIFGSTYWVYSDISDSPLDEKMPVSPHEMYGLSKAVSEIEIMSSDIEYTILRFTNIFGMGSGIHPEEVVYHFIHSARTGLPILLEYGGKQVIDFIDVTDACSALKTVTESGSASNEIFNIGSGIPRSIASVGQIVREICQQKFNISVPIVTGLSENTGMKQRIVSIEKFHRTFPNIKFRSFEESVDMYIDNFPVI